MQPKFSDWLNRKPAGKKARKRIPKVSKKRGVQLGEYRKKRKAFLKENPYCEAFWTIVTHTKTMPVIGFYGTGPASVEIHHMKKPKCRYLNDESTWLAVCRWSHDWIEDHKDIARTLGLLAR